LVFGLITAFAPGLMDLFQSPEGVSAKSAFSSHVWFHGGLDILAFCIVVFGLSLGEPSARMVRAVGVAALLPTTAIAYSLAATPYWNPLFVVAGLGCLSFAAWGITLGARNRPA
jgi:hypothetical protein